jgi:hypothetical protein
LGAANLATYFGNRLHKILAPRSLRPSLFWHRRSYLHYASRGVVGVIAHHADDAVLQELWDQVTTVPDWVDREQIGRGQDVFHRYVGPSIIGLTFQSLLGGMSAGRGAETLARTGGFSVKVARRRLFATFQHVLDITHSIDSVKPGGIGFASSLRVRLLHAAVRRRIMQLGRGPTTGSRTSPATAVRRRGRSTKSRRLTRGGGGEWRTSWPRPATARSEAPWRAPVPLPAPTSRGHDARRHPACAKLFR